MKNIIALLLSTVLILNLCSCSRNSNTYATRTITDCAGDQVEIPENVTSIINCVTYGCQVMVGLGLGEYLVGINEDSIESPWMVEMYPKIAEIPKYAFEESAESLLKANADVVFVEQPEIARNLRSKGVTAITFSYFPIDEMRYAINMLGEILEGEALEKCEQYVTYLDNNIKSVADSLDGSLEQRETLYYINGVSNKGLYKTTGKGSTNCECAELSYTDFATSPLIESPTNMVDSEAILAENPENIIIGGVYQHVLYDKLISTPEWSNNSAVKNGNVFTVPMGISAWNRYGIEIALMIPWTSSKVYPEHFEYDAVQETIDFYNTFTNYELTEQQAQYILNGLTPNGEKEIAN